MAHVAFFIPPHFGDPKLIPPRLRDPRQRLAFTITPLYSSTHEARGLDELLFGMYFDVAVATTSELGIHGGLSSSGVFDKEGKET